MSHWSQDLRYGLRKLARAPLLSGVTVLVLALGIGASTAIFSVVDAVLLRPLPYQNPDRLVAVWEGARATPGAQIPVAPADFFDWQEQSREFERLAGYHSWSFNISGNGD